jgi:Tol biopolymer transport system component
VSVGAGGTQADGASFSPSLSADGRFVAFESRSTNLVPGDTNNAPDVFVRDRQAGQIERVSLATDGTQASGFSLFLRGSFSPSLSADGRFVAFVSDASNLVPGDTNNVYDVFVRDRQAGATERVSVGAGGAQADGASVSPSLSADGRLVAFESHATNLVPGDTNNAHDVFVRDREAGPIERVPLAADGGRANGESYSPSLSADGRFVAFESYATDLVPGDTNGQRDIFVRDRQAGTTERVSLTADGAQAGGNSTSLSLSADGRFVAFVSGDNLVPGDTNGVTDVFVRDRQAGATERVSVGAGGAQADEASSLPSLSADGRLVAFVSDAANLVPGDTNGQRDIFVRDRQAGATERVSLTTDDTQAGGAVGSSSRSLSPSLSADGRFVTFDSVATNLVPGDTNNAPDVFVHARDQSR